MNNQLFKALVLMSGGLDSTVCATLAVNTYGKENVIGVGFDYGQKHIAEQVAARQVADILGILLIPAIKLPDVFSGAGSSLLSESEVPTGGYPSTMGPLNTYVPFRNGTFLSLATALAQRFGVEVVYAGMHSEDASNWAYPDCTPEFIGSMANAIYVGTYFKTRLSTPLQMLTKTQVVKLGLELGAPLAFSYSCYNGTTPPCKTCPTCISRDQAFTANGVDQGYYTYNEKLSRIKRQLEKECK